MRFDDLLRVSIRQVYRYRRRYLGVVLAIAFGVAGLITMHTMGRQVKDTINQDLELIGGANLITSYFDNYRALRPHWFQTSTIQAMRRLSGVREVSPQAFAWVHIEWQKERRHVWAFGVDKTYWEVRNFWALTGRLFGPPEVTGHQRVCVLGALLAQRIFGQKPPEGESVKIEHDIYTVVGVLGGIRSMDLAGTVFLPLTTFADRIPKARQPDKVYVRCNTWDDTEKVAAAIPKLVGSHQDVEHLKVEFSKRALDHVKKVAWWVESFVYLAIAATLALGGFGIWNVMMATVRSRTREIGLKKAMGAEDRNILAQFITESLCLSVGAAVIGIILGRLMVEGVSLWLGTRPLEELFMSSVGLGLLFSVALGVGAGLYPSLQASRMEVVEATRYE